MCPYVTSVQTFRHQRRPNRLGRRSILINSRAVYLSYMLAFVVMSETNLEPVSAVNICADFYFCPLLDLYRWDPPESSELWHLTWFHNLTKDCSTFLDKELLLHKVQRLACLSYLVLVDQVYQSTECCHQSILFSLITDY